MGYKARKAGKYTVLHLNGEVDVSVTRDAREQVLKLIDGGRNLLVDLSAVSRIDSSGVAVLVEGFQIAQDKGLYFGLVAVSPAAMAVLQLARLDSVFDIHASVKERLRADG